MGKKSNNVTNALKVLLADTYTLYLKTQNYHWNVVGPNFRSLHKLFEEEYEELGKASDEIAERIREKGEVSPGSFEEFISLKTVSEAKNKVDAVGMIKDLVDTHEIMLKSMVPMMEQAKSEMDESTQDLIIGRIEFHEKAVWVLRSHLG